ncbi:PDC sensor domain-containing protein [Nocardioides daeguensis]|uniref:Cache domain-containing protein n=1 Tax=Nocardioides daeguensis TaxID=908359 RepID=A0ABP6V0D8_9ACTN|nr:cache domain-containing protein [Nocardioides daeguensis]MBV6728753.1 hypothetical protein [Nocardioides daeguensis]MCR1773637.1 hypothetical protein [Nocardioides daeguensis]
MSQTAAAAQARRIAAALSEILVPFYERMERVAATVAATPAPPGQWTESDLGPVQDRIVELIAEDDALVGMGFVPAPLVMAGQERAMLWWQRNDGRTSRLRLNFDRTSIDVYDYVEMEWFTQPAAGQARVSMGPYVDYSGSELYIVTAAVPVLVEGRFVGVAGADLLFGELERRLLDVLRKEPFEAVIVSAERRVIVANSARWVLGTRLASVPAAGVVDGDAVYAAVEPLPVGTGWVLALAGTEESGNNFG